MDNVYLKTELKATRENPDIVKSKWQYGMVLIGMALLRDSSEAVPPNGADHAARNDEDVTPEERAFVATAAIAPVLLPLIEHLGNLSDEEVRGDS